MKKVILCIEGDIYKTACMKNCAEAKFHINVQVVEAKTESELLEQVISENADEIMFMSDSGTEEFLNHLEGAHASRLNCEVRILLCRQFELAVSRVVREAVTVFSHLSKSARGKMRRINLIEPRHGRNLAEFLLSSH